MDRAAIFNRLAMQEQNTSQASHAGHSVIDPRLLEVLVCPLSKAALEYDRANQELISRAARLAFPIRDGIPIMVLDEARALEG